MSLNTFRNKVEQYLYLILQELKDFNKIFNKGYYQPISSTDADAPNNSIYYSTTQSVLCYKDSLGVSNPLY